MVEKEIKNENRLAKMEQKLDNLVEGVKEIHDDLRDHVRWEAEKYSDMDVKYSGKWVEKAFVGLASSVLAAIGAGVILYFINN